MNKIIVANIRKSDKRMKKLCALNGAQRFKKAKELVVGEAASLRVKLTNEQITEAAAQLCY